MKKVAAFCIPAHGHTNPMLPVVRELAGRGDEVRFYSFSEFQEKIERTGATFVCCDKYLPELSRKEEEGGGEKPENGISKKHERTIRGRGNTK